MVDSSLKHNKDFVNDFFDFLGEIMTKYDHSLIVGDLNVHVCCLDKITADDFLNLTDSFNLVQSGLTQELGHTLDLVLSYGIPVLNLEICHIMNPVTADQFSADFSQNYVMPETVCNNTEELCSWIDSMAPLKTRQPKTKSGPWLKDKTPAVTHKCHRAESK